MQCEFGELDADSTTTVRISVRANQRGSHVSSLKLTSVNDTNPANDQRDVAFEITGGQDVAAASSGGGGGGGGSFEWLTLLLLGTGLFISVRERLRATPAP